MKMMPMLLAGAALCACAAVPASAATVIITYSGTVTSGQDVTGEFGAANTDLTGKSFVARFVFDPTLGTTSLYGPGSAGSYGGTGKGSNGRGPATDAATVTIGGISKSVTSTGSSHVSNNNDGRQAEQYSSIQHYFGDGTTYGAQNLYAGTYGKGFNLPLNFGSYTGPGGANSYGGYSASAYDYLADRYTMEVSADFSITSLSISAAGVPEPATWGMMILGFGLIGTALRRRGSAVRTTVRFA